MIRGSEGLGVKDIALLFTDLKGSTALYDRIGDLNAFALVQQHFDRLQDVTVRHNGAIIKTIGDAVMAAFLKPADAVQAALEMRSEIASFNERQPDKALILKIGVHKGAAIAVTLNDRLDYFGQTVNIAARVQNLADADEIFVSQDVYDAAGVRDETGGLCGRAANSAASRRAAGAAGVSGGGRQRLHKTETACPSIRRQQPLGTRRTGKLLISLDPERFPSAEPLPSPSTNDLISKVVCERF